MIWRRIGGGTGSEVGNRFVERVLSVVATCREQDTNVLDYLARCYQSHRERRPTPSLIPTSRVTRVA